MVDVIFNGRQSAAIKIEGSEGESVMYAALSNRVGGILGECGGSLACATCHVYVDEAWLDRLEPMADLENEMLDATACERQPNSRLCCQIELTASLSGLTLTIPEAQV